MFGFYSDGIAKIKNLDIFLGQKCTKIKPFSSDIHKVFSWGYKGKYLKIKRYAVTHNIDQFFIEDGFICSVKKNTLKLSLIVDKLGIYYDSKKPSDLEKLISKPLNEKQNKRAKEIISIYKKNKITKYNELIFREFYFRDYVLIVDQIENDLSLVHGNVKQFKLEDMVLAAKSEFPKHKIIIKLHPDSFLKDRFGLDKGDIIKKYKDIQFIRGDYNAIALIKKAKAVYTLTSQVGFDALIWGKRVRCFGMPFYAGWGLTGDELPAPKRRGKANLEQIVHAALVKYPRYVDPVSDDLCEVERVIEFIGLQRKLRLDLPSNIQAVGFSRWKRGFIKDFLQVSSLCFVKKITSELIQSEKPIILWGSKDYQLTRDRNKVYRIEDGFLRSSGLGADLVNPISIVVDKVGIYFDATRPSQLESFLSQHSFTDSEIERAAHLHKKILSMGLTKYNVDKGVWSRPKWCNKVLLVVGQVESDASIKFGSPVTRSNYALLNQVRVENPDAYIIYKPHPDVLGKLRKVGIEENNVESLCDEIIGNIEINKLLSQIDELHTMTSLMGFEALIRGKHVVCYGLPFYAGWGLTEDRIKCKRRKRKLTMEQLIYATLIEYPRYLHPTKKIFLKAEEAVDILAEERKRGPKKRSLYRKLIRITMVLLNFIRRK